MSGNDDSTTAMIPCAKCKGIIAVKFAPNNGGVITKLGPDGYCLVADWVYHNKCWDDYYSECYVNVTGESPHAE